MARVDKIVIKNFKGIDEVEIVLEDEKPSGRFITLIGLNESGKTTVLESLSHSILADQGTVDLMENVQGPPEINDLIPKKNKAAFNGIISIKTFISLSDEEVEEIRKFLFRRYNYVPVQSLPSTIDLDRQYLFQDSTYLRTTNYWSFTAKLRKKTGTKIYELTSYNIRSEWLDTVNFIKPLLPQVIYFPTFLVDFPRRIYLEGNHGEIDQYYRNVINDALCSLNTPLTIEKHIIARVNKHRKKTGPFSSSLRASPEGQQIDATMQALAGELNRVIFGAWSDIFGKKITGRRLQVEWHIDETGGRHTYLELSIVAENNIKFYVSERSLGFRWFFSFLLFTQFQAFRTERARAIFLFDEPASHLHARAQQRLLQSFEKIAEPHHLIVYSTHSHYLINPLWLEKAYIVSNDAFSVDEDDPNDELSNKQTVIRLCKYRQFVSDNPTKTTYYQPALDALDYAVSPLTLSQPAVLLEGKFDFYPFAYLSTRICEGLPYRAFPANGAGSMASLISLHRGWGVPFVVLLDDDDAGRREKKRYKKEFGLSDDEIVTLGDLTDGLAGLQFEDMFVADAKSAWESQGHSGGPTKQDYYLYFQALLNGAVDDPDLPDTLAIFHKVASGLADRIIKQQSKTSN